jgi:hypothetical protein
MVDLVVSDPSFNTMFFSLDQQGAMAFPISGFSQYNTATVWQA